MATILHDRDGHRCLMFSSLSDEGGEAVQSNQCLIVDGDSGADIDPGGNIAYSELFVAMSREFAPSRLTALLASHADPDIVAALDRWTTATQARIFISRLWERFLPHICKAGKTSGRIVGIPDEGMRIRVGRHDLIAVPAHFMHAEGNFQFFDPVSGILFSGDLGVSLMPGRQAASPISSLDPLPPGMEAFHQRYMASNKVLRLWADMVTELPIRMIVPQHGAPLQGPAVAQFIAWIRELPCGVDLFGPRQYRIPA